MEYESQYFFSFFLIWQAVTNCFANVKQYTTKLNESVLNTITLYFEDDNYEEINFKGKALTFTLQLVKICIFKEVFKNLKPFLFALVKNTTLVQKILLVR